MLSIGLCKVKKHRAKVVRKKVVRRDLAPQKTSSNSCPAAPKVYLATDVVAESYKLDKHHIVWVLSGCCPDVVWKLSGSCPDLVRGEDRINTKLQGGQNWTYIQRLTISRPVMGTVFCALSFEGGRRA